MFTPPDFNSKPQRAHRVTARPRLAGRARGPGLGLAALLLGSGGALHADTGHRHEAATRDLHPVVQTHGTATPSARSTHRRHPIGWALAVGLIGAAVWHKDE